MNPKNPERLLRFCVLVTERQKEFIEAIGKQHGSEYVRKLIAAQMDTHEAEVSILEEELRQHEVHTNLLQAKIRELKSSDMQKQAASQGREEIIVKIARRLKSNLNRNHYKGGWDVTKDFPKLLKTNVSDENRMPAISNGGVEPIQEDEVMAMIYKILEAEAEAETKAKVKKVQL